MMRHCSSGLLLVERVNWLSDLRFGGGAQPRDSVIGLSVDAVLQRYRGIEGDPWPLDLDSFEIELEDGLAPLNQLDRVLRYSVEAARETDVDLLHIAVEGAISEVPVLPSDLQFMGYDVGVWESETNLFSILMNDVIFGRQPTLTQFADRLNSSLLLPGDGSVQDLIHAREQLVTAGADLETWDAGEQIL
jgi:hypothetical protein